MGKLEQVFKEDETIINPLLLKWSFFSWFYNSNFCGSTVPAAGYFLRDQKVTKKSLDPRGSGPPAIHPVFRRSSSALGHSCPPLVRLFLDHTSMTFRRAIRFRLPVATAVLYPIKKRRSPSSVKAGNVL